MAQFEIKEDFILNGEPMKILSGAIHYFRVHPDDWYHSLYNLKALGFNTVETYVPWNMHEPYEGEYHFDGMLDIERFLNIAQELGLYAIVRPSPYICAEWEFGGMPAWLLEKDVRLRSSDSRYLEYVGRYYDHLIPKLLPHQLSEGGNVLMFQVENEYGSYGEDKEYLKQLSHMMLERGIKQPLFTSDGPWRATLRAGSLIDEDIFTTGNFGSKAKKNFDSMQSFFDEHGKKWPLMTMEFWDGWFNRYNEPIVTRETDELVDAVKEAMELGSINLYMFHGGTNFGFMNGCSARLQHDLPQVTSYDYGAPLDEQGNPTEKYYALQKMMNEYFPEYETKEPLVKESMAVSDIPLTDKVSLFEVADDLVTPQRTKYPKTMEALGQNTGYTLYQTQIEKDTDDPERIRVVDARDRVHVYTNGNHVKTQYQEEIGEDINVKLDTEVIDLTVLVENMGRVNYGHKFVAPTQRKGIRNGVAIDLHFATDWVQYPLSLEDVSAIDYTKDHHNNQPGFYKFTVDIDQPKDTFIDMEGFGKGVVFVNNHNVGRYWEVGPYLTLYVATGFLHSGENEIVVFETEGKYQDHINLVDSPKVMDIKE